MIGYDLAWLEIDGRRVHPSVGSGLPGPFIPDADDRTHSHYRIMGTRNGETFVLAEARRVGKRWKIRRRGLDGRLTPYIWEDTIRRNADDVGVYFSATRVHDGGTEYLF